MKIFDFLKWLNGCGSVDLLYMSSNRIGTRMVKVQLCSVLVGGTGGGEEGERGRTREREMKEVNKKRIRINMKREKENGTKRNKMKKKAREK